MITAIRRLRRCPYCGSEHLVLDERNGALVCADCGNVIEDVVVDYSQPGSQPLQGQRWEPIPVREERRFQARQRSLRRMALRLLGEPRLLVSLGDNALEEVSDACIRSRIKRMRSAEERAVALEAAAMLRLGEYPLPSIYAAKYGLPKKRVKAILERISECLETVTR